MTTVCVLLPAEPGDGSWIDAAVEATARLGEGAAVEVVVGVPGVLPSADVVLAHGIQYEGLLRASTDRRQRMVMSDRPADLTGLEHVTLVDWAWWEAAEVAGEEAARRASGGPVALVAGPPVPTQSRLAEAFARGVDRAATGSIAHVEHLPAFDDVEAGRAAGHGVVAAGSRVLLTTADAAGDAAAAVAREHGVVTYGFLHAHPDDAGHVRSDVAGVLADLVRAAVAGEPLPACFDAGLASGRLSFELAPTS